MHRIPVVLGLAALLSGCAGMNRAVGVLPNTLDDLGGRRAAADAPNPAPAPPPGPAQPGDAALAVRP